ncbi:MAG: hypothetical protein ACKVUS_18635 [Saprospiraceae bacterium]
MRIRLLLLLIAVFYLLSLLYSERARATLDGSDSWGYYVHLPAFLLYHDTGDYSKTIAAWQANYPNKSDPRRDAYGIRPTPTGKFAVKYPIGLALLESPFFLMAHLYCLVGSAHLADGFSAPYAWAIALSSLFFAVLGLFFLFKNLRFYFSEKISLIATAMVGLATNLFFFVAYTPGMAHPAAFCLIAFLILATRRWHENPTQRNAFALGCTLGFIALVRTQDLVVAVVPLLWGIGRWRDVPARARFLWEKKSSVGAAGLAFALALLPQAVYWKFVSGQWWHYGYQGETFDWSQPHIWQGLFSFQNGWLIYTPVMALALWGILRLRRHAPHLLLPMLVFLPLHWLVSYAWWCWMYINGFGSRPMVDAYGLLAFPLAAWMAGQKRTWILLLVLGGFVVLNLFQTWQTQHGIFWSERGNWAFYKEIFGQTRGSERALSAFESGEVQPPEPLRFSKTLFVKSTSDAPENTTQVGGRTATKCPSEFNQTTTLANDTTRLLPGDWLRVSAAAFVPKDSTARSVDQLAKLVVDFTDPKAQVLKYRALAIGTHIGNPNYILWKIKGTGEWGEASFFVMVPMGFDAGSRLKMYVWNPHGQAVFLSELRAELWR